MVYRFLKWMVRWVLKLFFRKLYISGTEHIKEGKAQIIACNHPSGFMEPLIMACFFPKDLYFLVRGDVFENPLLKPLLIATHQIPIYRFKDGFSKLRENASTVEASTEVLSQHKSLLIFVEGSTKSIRMLRPLQKGMTRIALQTLNQYPDTRLEIVPVGINFSHPLSGGKDVALTISSPIPIEGEIPESPDQIKKLQEELLEKVYLRMKENILHFDHQDRAESAEPLLRMIWEKFYLKNPVKVSSDTEAVRVLTDFAARWDNLPEEKYQEWKQRLKKWKNITGKNESSAGVLPEFSLSAKDKMILLLGGLPAFYGYLFNVLPVIAGLWLTGLLVNQKEFRTSVLMICWFAVFLIYYAGCIVAGFWDFRLWIAAFAGIWSGILLLRLRPLFSYWLRRSDATRLSIWHEIKSGLKKDFNLHIFQ